MKKRAAAKLIKENSLPEERALPEVKDLPPVKNSLQVNLSDFAFFLSVMKEKEAYRCVLSIILDEPDLELKEVKVEKVILNKSGKRAIRMDAWAIDHRQLPSTAIIFITQEDLFGRDMAKYTFLEKCEEVEDLYLEDGTRKIFLNMSSKNGSDELISLLQYMKETTLDNPDIRVQDERLKQLDRIVKEVKESEEWEEVSMNILEYGLEKGTEKGSLLKQIELIQKKAFKGKSLLQIADELETEPADIKPLYEIIVQNPNADKEEIYDSYSGTKPVDML